MLFYMDDILLVGRSKRDLTIAVKRIRAYLHDTLRLEIHPTWNVKHVGVEPIDMVGFTFYPNHTGVRAGIFLRARRSFRRYARNPTSLRLAYRCASYYGWLKNSDSIQYRPPRQKHRRGKPKERITDDSKRLFRNPVGKGGLPSPR